MCLKYHVVWKDGEWTPIWAQEEVLTAGKKGGPTKVSQCEPPVFGTIGFYACWCKPVADRIGVLITWSLAYRSKCDQTSFSPFMARVRDPVSHAVLRAVTGPEAYCYAIQNREWTCQVSAREELDILFKERCDKNEADAGIACARAEKLLHDYLLEKEDLVLNDLPGIIRSVEHLLLYLNEAKVDDMPASQALGLFIHEHFETNRGDQASLRFVLNIVIDMLRLDPPGRIVSENPPVYQPTIVRGLAPNLNKGLEEHCGLFSTTTKSKFSLVARCQRALTAVGVTNAMTFDEVKENLGRNEAAHDAHRYTDAERSGQHEGGEKRSSFTEGQMRRGLAHARHHFLELETDKQPEWTPGINFPPMMPQAMNQALQCKFEGFLREYGGGPLEPGFAEVVNWALAAYEVDADFNDDDVKLFLVDRQEELAEATWDVKELGYFTTDVAMRKALQLLRECLQQDE